MNLQKSSIKIFLTIISLVLVQCSFAQTTTKVKHFSKVIVSPNIQVTFIEGNEESVTIDKATVSNDKIHLEVTGSTLRIYLDGQKEFPKNETIYVNGHKEKDAVYKGTVVTATVIYKTLNDLSIRGEETQICKSKLALKEFNLKIYGESHVILEEVNLDNLQASIYGESTLEVKSGKINDQRYIAYGASIVKSFGIDNNNTKIIAYGESRFSIKSADNIKMTAYGAARLDYKGGATISRGMNIGNVQIAKVD